MNIFKTYKKTLAISLLLCMATNQVQAFDLKSLIPHFKKNYKKTTIFSALKKYEKYINKKTIIGAATFFSSFVIASIYFYIKNKNNGNRNPGQNNPDNQNRPDNSTNNTQEINNNNNNNINNNKKVEDNPAEPTELMDLHTECWLGSIDNVKNIIENDPNIDINAKNLFGDTPIHSALNSDNNIEVIKLLVDKKANLEIKNNNNQTPLERACFTGQLEIAKLLIKAKANLNVMDNKGLSILDRAFDDKNINLINFLLEYEAGFAKYNLTKVFHKAIETNNQIIIKFIIDNRQKIGFDINNNQGKVNNLFNAINNGNIETVKTLINNGFNVNINDMYGYSLLDYAIINGRDDLAELLINSGANLNIIGKNKHTPLTLAITYKRNNIAKIIIKLKTTVNTLNGKGETPAYLLVKESVFNFSIIQTPNIRKDNIELLQLLIDNGGNINLKNTDGDNPLNLAIDMKLEDFAIFLLDNSANPTTEDKSGGLPILKACSQNLLKIVESLITHGADVDQEDDTGKTLLIYGCENLNIPLVELLIKKKVNINKIDKNGKTALDYVPKIIINNNFRAYFEQMQLTDLLLRSGAKSGSVRQNFNNNIPNAKNAYDQDDQPEIENLETKITGLITGAKGLPSNAYKILNVDIFSTDDVIKKACKKLQLKFHPDNYPDEKDKKQAEENFQNAAIARDVLCHKQAKIEYNKKLNSGEIRYKN